MKKIILFFIVLSILFISCSSDNNILPNENQIQKTITFNLLGNFNISTRADIDEAEDILILDYLQGQCIQVIHQTKGDNNFGNPSINLSYGSHNLYFLVSKGKDIDLQTDLCIVSWRKVGDTFWATKSIYVDNNTSSSISITLNRVSTLLEIQSTDRIPNNKNYIEVTCQKWSNSFNYIMGKSSSLGVSTIKYELRNTDYLDFIMYGISSNTEYISEVSISYYSTEGFVKSQVFPEVPFMANRVTRITGPVFGQPTSNEYGCNILLKLNTEWDSIYQIQ